MKLVAIIGSPNGMNGNTGALLNGVLEGARKAGAEVELFSLTEKDVQPCRGCDACHISGTCSINDDFAGIRSAIEQADGVILASPNYFFSVSAQLKALIDRCAPIIHIQSLIGKYAAAVVTSGGPGSDEVEQYTLRVLCALGFTTTGSIGAMGYQLYLETMKMPLLTAAAEVGAGLVTAIATQQQYPEQQEARQAVMARMRKLVKMQKARWPYEYHYWVEHHGLAE